MVSHVASVNIVASVFVASAQVPHGLVGAVAVDGGAGFVKAVGSGELEAVQVRAVVADGVVQTAVQEVGGGPGGAVHASAVDPRVKLFHVGVQVGAQLTQTHSTEVAGQAHEAVAGSPGVVVAFAGSPGVAVAIAAVCASGAVDVQALLNLPDSLQAVAQVFAALEADQGAGVVDAGGGLGCAAGVGQGLAVFDAGFDGAVQGHVGHGGHRQGSNCQSDQFFHGENPFKSVKVQLVTAWPPRKNVCASRKRRRRHGGEYSR